MERQKTVLITGATRGIGRATALLFAKKGYLVVANYKSSDALAQTLQAELLRFNPRSFVYKADVSDPTAVHDMFCALYRTFDRLDVLVNNAGVAEQVLLLDMSTEQFSGMLNHNLLPVFFLSREYLLRQTALEAEGAIVNVASIYGIDGGALESHYSAAKAGIIGFTKAIAKEYCNMKIRANAVAPGAIATDMTLSHSAETLALLREEIPLGRLGTAEEVADGILFLAEAQYITGEVLKIAGGI